MEENDLIIKRKKQEKKKSNKISKFFWNVVFIVCLGVFIYSSFNLAKDYYGSYKAGNNLKNLKTSVFKDKNLSEKKVGENKVVDIKKLKELNKDAIGWIEIPDTNLDEPLVQGNDNDYYLWRSFDKKTYPLTGTIFLDVYNKKDFSDRISYIFGHNMWDKTKFSCFVNFENKEFLENHKQVFIHTEDKLLEYEIIGVDLVDPNTPLYEQSSDRNKDLNFIKKELSKHISKDEVDKIDENSKLLMLVTCKKPDDNTLRRILFAKLINVKDKEK